MGMQERAFRPLAATQTATATASSAVISLNYTMGTRSVRVANVGANAINLNIGTAVSVAATTTTSLVMLGNTVEVFTLAPAENYIAVIANTTTGSVVYCTVGEGL